MSYGRWLFINIGCDIYGDFEVCTQDNARKTLTFCGYHCHEVCGIDICVSIFQREVCLFNEFF